MKKVTRKGVFETNSSSSHSLCISRNTPLTDWRKYFGDKPTISGDDFGWDEYTFTDPPTKLAYLVTAALNKEEGGCKILLDRIKEAFKEHTGEDLTIVEKEDDFWTNGYIDHQSADVPFEALGSKEKIIDFVFRSGSTLVTDNDNH